MNGIEYTFLSELVAFPANYARLKGNFRAEFLQDETAREIFAAMAELGSFDLLSLRDRLKGRVDFQLLLELNRDTVFAKPIMFDCYAMKLVEDWKTLEKKRIVDEEGITPASMQKVAEIENFELYPAEIEDASAEYLRRVEGKYTGKGDENVIPTGFAGIDRILEGFGKSELVVLAGNSGAGKTTMAINLAYNMAKSGKNILFFSLEMKESELHERLVKNIANVSNYTKMSQTDFDKVVKTSRAVKERLPIEVCDKNITLEAMYSLAKDKPGLDVVFIDHLNILTTSERIRDKLERLEYLTRRLKEMAKELDVPIVCLCQLNRANSDREVKRPMLSDLRGSGSIEQDANLVLFVYSPEYYLLQAKPDETSKNYDKWETEYLKNKGKTTVMVAKNRRGRTGDIGFRFEKDFCRFVEEEGQNGFF